MLSSRLIKPNKPGRGTMVRNPEKRHARWGLLHNTTPIFSSRLCHCGRSRSQPLSSKSREVILISAPSSLSAEGKVALLAVAVTGRWGWGLRHTTCGTTSTYFPLIKKEARAANQPATSPDLLRCRGCCREVWERGQAARWHGVALHH